MAFHPLILVSSNLHICFRCFFRMRTQQCGFMGLVPERCLLFQQIHIIASRAKISNLVDFGKGSSLPSILGPLGTQISTILRLGSRWNISNKTLEMGPWVGLKAKRRSSPNRYGKTITNHILSPPGFSGLLSVSKAASQPANQPRHSLSWKINVLMVEETRLATALCLGDVFYVFIQVKHVLT